MTSSANNKNNSATYSSAIWQLCKDHWQRVSLIALLLVYAFFIFYKIGDFSMPYSSFRFNTATKEEAASEIIVVTTPKKR